MLVLGLETSCDETAAAVLKNGDCLLSNVINEIHIISLMMNESGEIREDTVVTIVKDNMEFPIWRFLDALGCKDIVSSVRILHSLCEHGNLAPPIMINLTTFFRKYVLDAE